VLKFVIICSSYQIKKKKKKKKKERKSQKKDDQIKGEKKLAVSWIIIFGKVAASFSR
jgi:hypothetical protein